MIKGVVFDLGSTLIRYTGEWQEAIDKGVVALIQQLELEGFPLNGSDFTQAFKRGIEFNYRKRDADTIERTTASLLQESLVDFGFRDVSEDVVTRALTRFYAYSESLWEPMPDVYAVLDGFQKEGFRLGIISNAGDENNVQRLIDNARLRPFFDPILISAAVGIRKPDPKLFYQVLEEWNLPAHHAVMVGDMLGADILGAKRVGMHQIWLTAQADHESNYALVGEVIPEATAMSLSEIPTLIRKMDTMPPEG